MVDENGEQLGILPTREAYSIAQERGLDLVEVAPNERPPVCRIMDFGKFKYEQKKKAQESRKKQHTLQVKEIRLRPKTDPHDIEIKTRRAYGFLADGHKVQVAMNFRGREMAHRDRGFAIMKSVAESLSDVCKVERLPAMDGRRMIMILMRKPGWSGPKKPKPDGKPTSGGNEKPAPAPKPAVAESPSESAGSDGNPSS